MAKLKCFQKYVVGLSTHYMAEKVKQYIFRGKYIKANTPLLFDGASFVMKTWGFPNYYTIYFKNLSILQ